MLYFRNIYQCREILRNLITFVSKPPSSLINNGWSDSAVTCDILHVLRSYKYCVMSTHRCYDILLKGKVYVRVENELHMDRWKRIIIRIKEVSNPATAQINWKFNSFSVWTTAVFSQVEVGSRTGPRFTNVFFHRNSNSMEISFYSHLDSITVIATKFCTWHDSCAVVACAKICCDLMASNGVIARRSFYRI